MLQPVVKKSGTAKIAPNLWGCEEVICKVNELKGEHSGLYEKNMCNLFSYYFNSVQFNK